MKIDTNKLNKPLIRRVIRKIKSEPRAFDMSVVLSSAAECDLYGESCPPCNTVGCVAGWAYMLTHKLRNYGSFLKHGKLRNDVIEHAAELLGLNGDGRNVSYRSVFFATEWPEPFRQEYQNIMRYVGGKPRAMIDRQRDEANLTVRRLQHLMRTGE
jgi:hypothetical protein